MTEAGFATAPATASINKGGDGAAQRGLLAQWVTIVCAEILSVLDHGENAGKNDFVLTH